MVRRGRKDAQIVILVKPELQADLDTIRIVTATSRARVVEPMLTVAVDAELDRLAPQLGRVAWLAERAGVSVREYATAYGKAFSKHAYGPGLDSLEADDRIVTQHIVRPAPVAG